MGAYKNHRKNLVKAEPAILISTNHSCYNIFLFIVTFSLRTSSTSTIVHHEANVTQ